MTVLTADASSKFGYAYGNPRIWPTGYMFKSFCSPPHPRFSNSIEQLIRLRKALYIQLQQKDKNQNSCKTCIEWGLSGSQFLCPQRHITFLEHWCVTTHRALPTREDHLSFTVHSFYWGFHYIGVINQITGHRFNSITSFSPFQRGWTDMWLKASTF
jgi:hypothetical protein